MADPKKVFSEHKPAITKHLKKYLQSRSQLINLNQWGKPYLEIVPEYATTGKMGRGTLLITSYLMSGGRSVNETILNLAVAMELMQSTLLMHDDLMDRDDLRRGKPAMHKRLQSIGKRKKVREDYHFGESAAICFGDIGFFLNRDLITRAKLTGTQKDRIHQAFSEVMVKTGMAQIDDVFYSMKDRIDKPATILRILDNKSGLYTISLPLVVGAIAAGKNQAFVDKLYTLGKDLGLLFQIHDDQIGMFGDAKKTGKPVGSDVAENKKTLYHYYLFKRAKGNDLKKLDKIFGKIKITQADMKFVHQMIEKYQVQEEVLKYKRKYAKSSMRMIKQLSVPQKYKDLLAVIVEYTGAREQ